VDLSPVTGAPRPLSCGAGPSPWESLQATAVHEVD
jgi:hypothetical protein